MAVERTGTAVSINTATASSSQSITVPSDCTCALLFWGGWSSDPASHFASGTYSASLGASSFTHVVASYATGNNGDDVACAYLVNPPTGSQTLSWTFNSSVNAGYLIAVVFYKGVNTSSPIGASGGIEAETTSPLSLSGLSYSTGDMLVGAAIKDTSASSLDTNSQTVIITPLGAAAKSGSTYLSVAEKASTGTLQGTQGSSEYLAMVAVVLAMAGIATLDQHSFRFFNDNGSESAATAKAALNTNINLSANDVARIRFLINATGDVAVKNFQLEYRKKPSGGSFGDWKRVTIN